jgi:preprotein translocase subunit SecD
MKIGWRVWLLVVFLGLSVLAIKPSFQEGVLVKSVDQESEIFNQGLKVGEVIREINGNEIKNKEDYGNVISRIFMDGGEKRIEINAGESQYIFLTNQTPEIAVDDIPRTNIKTGLDLRGGARALVEAEQELTENQLEELIAVARNRFNVYGIQDVQIRGVSDLEGNKFMLIEIAGATPDNLRKLIEDQGIFEARIGNQTVFESVRGDIADVARDAQRAGIRSCNPAGDNYFCNFDFTIYLTEGAAEKHAEITSELGLDETGQYLDQNLDLILDGNNVSSLKISSGLRGQKTTQISIQGGETAETRDEAYNRASEEMKRLQTILKTGSLPYKLNIVKLDTVSPTLGGAFTRSILLAGISAIVLVSLIVLVRYRNFKASLALLLTSFSELFIILGVAALIKWNLDLPSIAGILATIGTGVDQQIVILDEASKHKEIGIKSRLKRALFVIFTAYITSVVALLPLYWAGAGLFRGFAFTTIIGITAGVLITRPAFADIIGRLEK